MGVESVWIYLLLSALVLVLIALAWSRWSGPRTRPGEFASAETRTAGELERLVGELREMSRETLARLDHQIITLRQLLEEANRKVYELRSLLGKPSEGRAVAAPSPAPSGNPLHEQVYALRDAGRDISEISTATGLEKGEIELILGLRQVPPLKPSGGASGPA